MMRNPEMIVVFWLAPGIFCFFIALAMYFTSTTRKIFEKIKGKLDQSEKSELIKEAQEGNQDTIVNVPFQHLLGNIPKSG